jgi:hypothetical protein
MIDRQGKLFGKFSLLDIGAVLAILFVVGGIFFSPNGVSPTRGQSPMTTVETDLFAAGVKLLKPEDLIKDFAPGTKLNFMIRNQPAGQVDIKSVRQVPRTIAVPQPDGSIKAVQDPREESSFSTDLVITVVGQGKDSPEGLVLGGTKMKIATTVEIDRPRYNFNTTVIDIRYPK